MGTLHGPIICHPVVNARNGGNMLVNTSLALKGTILRSGFRGSKVVIRVGPLFSQRRSLSVNCSFSSSDGNGSMAGNFSESDGDYVNSSVIEAVEVKSGSDGFMIKMRDGKSLRCVHNNPQGGNLPDCAPHPAIVLKMEDGSELLLPIIVLEMPSILLMAAVRNVQIARPTIYQVVKDTIDKMGYQVKLVRVTKRVHEAYFAQLYLTKVGNEKECISFDLRPSDAINMAVRCKFWSYEHFYIGRPVTSILSNVGVFSVAMRWPTDVVDYQHYQYRTVSLYRSQFDTLRYNQVPIQVNKHVAYSDGMKVVVPSKVAVHSPFSDGLLLDFDRPDGQPCLESIEFDLVRNMLIAAVEERYKDAAQWKDKLKQLRAKRKKNWA